MTQLITNLNIKFTLKFQQKMHPLFIWTWIYKPKNIYIICYHTQTITSVILCIVRQSQSRFVPGKQTSVNKCGALRDLVPFVKFKKREKHPYRNVNFSKVAGFQSATLLKLTFFHGCFSRFLNCANGTKSRNAPHISNMKTWFLRWDYPNNFVESEIKKVKFPCVSNNILKTDYQKGPL